MTVTSDPGRRRLALLNDAGALVPRTRVGKPTFSGQNEEVTQNQILRLFQMRLGPVNRMVQLLGLPEVCVKSGLPRAEGPLPLKAGKSQATKKL